MAIRLVIDGNAVYEIDEDCLERQKKREKIGQKGRRPVSEKDRTPLSEKKK